jgi:hypothetical protein
VSVLATTSASVFCVAALYLHAAAGLTPFVDHYLETALTVDATGLLINAKRGMFSESA